MSAVKFPVLLDFEQKASFLDRHNINDIDFKETFYVIGHRSGNFMFLLTFY